MAYSSMDRSNGRSTSSCDRQQVLGTSLTNLLARTKIKLKCRIIMPLPDTPAKALLEEDQFLGDKLVNWMAKKQIVLQCPSAIEAESTGVICKKFSSNVECEPLFKILAATTNKIPLPFPKKGFSTSSERIWYEMVEPSKLEFVTEKSLELQQTSTNPTLLAETLSREFFESPEHRIHKDGDGDALIQAEVGFITHALAQTTKT
ncbi:hypothetical protein Tco_1147462 [Tanacetum coccineum]